MPSKRIYNIYFKEAKIINRYRVFNSDSKAFTSMTYQELSTLSRKYELFQGYEKNDESLLKFYNDFELWNNELYRNYCTKKGHLSVYDLYYNNEFAVVETFCKCSKSVYNLKKNKFDRIDGIEGYWFENCNNGGLSYAIEGVHSCVGYDFISFYPTMLGNDEYSFQIPLNKGKQYKVKNLERIQYGFYKVIIECNNELFKKQFNFSKNNVYTHFSLNYALKRQQEYNISIELDMTSEYNAYLYDDNDLISTFEIFGDWYNELIEFKTKHPRNKLVKHLLSSLWGSISKKKLLYVKENDLGNYDWDTRKGNSTEYLMIENNLDEGNEYYTLKKIDDPYEYNIRLKPFLLSYSRNVMANIIYNHFPDKVVRVFCDSIVFNDDITMNNKFMIKEDKSCGLYYFKNSYNVHQLCTKCHCVIERGNFFCEGCGLK